MGFLKKRKPGLIERVLTPGSVESQVAQLALQVAGGWVQHHFRHVDRQDDVAQAAEERKARRDHARNAAQRASELRKILELPLAPEERRQFVELLVKAVEKME